MPFSSLLSIHPDRARSLPHPSDPLLLLKLSELLVHTTNYPPNPPRPIPLALTPSPTLPLPISPETLAQTSTYMYSGQGFSSICLTPPHFRRLTQCRDRFCLHFLSQSLHEFQGEKMIAFLCVDNLLPFIISLSLLLTSI